MPAQLIGVYQTYSNHNSHIKHINLPIINKQKNLNRYTVTESSLFCARLETMEEIEDPLEMCRAWIKHATPIISPLSLTSICVTKVNYMLEMYPRTSDLKVKRELMRGLRGLLDIPHQFVQEFKIKLLEFFLRADKGYHSRSLNSGRK